MTVLAGDVAAVIPHPGDLDDHFTAIERRSNSDQTATQWRSSGDRLVGEAMSRRRRRRNPPVSVFEDAPGANAAFTAARAESDGGHMILNEDR